MAQVTESLIASQRARHARGEHVNLTINEEEQLLWAWEELQHRRRIDQIREIGGDYERMAVTQALGLGHYTGGHVDRWTWDFDALNSLSREESVSILARLSALPVKRTTVIADGQGFIDLPVCWPGPNEAGAQRG